MAELYVETEGIHAPRDDRTALVRLSVSEIDVIEDALHALTYCSDEELARGWTRSGVEELTESLSRIRNGIQAN